MVRHCAVNDVLTLEGLKTFTGEAGEWSFEGEEAAKARLACPPRRQGLWNCGRSACALRSSERRLDARGAERAHQRFAPPAAPLKP
jgi:hypothetical protein